MAQRLLVSNTVVLSRSNLVFVTGAPSIGSGNVITINLGKYVKRIFVNFQNVIVAVPLDTAMFVLADSVGADYGRWFRNDLASLNFGLIESSNYVEEFRHFKVAGAQHLYSWMIRVENYIDFIQFIWTRPGANIKYEVFIQDE